VKELKLFGDNTKKNNIAEKQALDSFSRELSNIPPTDKDYEKKVEEARKSAILSVIKESGKKLETPNWFSPGSTNTALGRRWYEEILPQIETDIEFTDIPKPQPLWEEIDLSKKTDPARGDNPSDKNAPVQDNSPAGMVPGGRVSSGFTDKRDGGKRQHSALDVAAPEGTPITSADFGVPLTVVKRAAGKVTGNFMTLRGKTEDGKTLEVRLLHLQNHEGAKEGTVVSPGDLLGYVGNTGSTSTGPHMHIDISIDGKRVDPEKYLKSISAAPPSSLAPSEPASADMRPPLEIFPAMPEEEEEESDRRQGDR
jgi:murein DD-endopeptidase MepM/ murein hydrolase activator NlpD